MMTTQRFVGFLLVTLLAAPACSDAAGDAAPLQTPAAASLLDPPAPGTGVQFRMVTKLEAGVETERCHFFQVPAEGLHVQRAVTRYAPGSHHVVLWRTPYPEIPATDIN